MIAFKKLLTIKEAAKHFGVSPLTLRRWEKKKKLIPFQRTPGGQRRYSIDQMPFVDKARLDADLPTVAYARVSSHDQKEALDRQVQMLTLYCSSRGWDFSITQDLGSGMNYHKKGLKQLLEKILQGKLNRLVLTHKDRLLRFGSELIFALCALKNIEIVIINQGDEPSFEEELAQDVLEIITVFSARLYGSRSHKNKKLMKNLQTAAKNA